MTQAGRQGRLIDPTDNGFGAIRLMLAALVIVSHTFELRDGSRVAEPLTRLCHTISLGDLAVDGFFVLSGFLIAGSLASAHGTRDYLRRRVARIYPAFLVCTLLCLGVLAPITGFVWPRSAGEAVSLVIRTALLLEPRLEPLRAALPYPTLNSSMWTIAHEFRCYLFLALIGAMGLLRRPRAVMGLTAFVWVLWLVSIEPYHDYVPAPWVPVDAFAPGGGRHLMEWIGTINWRLLGAFLIGVCFWLHRDRLRATPRNLLGAAMLMLAGLQVFRLADLSVALGGGWLMLALAGHARGTVLARINSRTDISYGFYLYGWPIERTLLLALPGLSPLPVGLLTMALTAIAGWCSWRWIEAPVLRRVRWRPVPRVQSSAAMSLAIDSGLSVGA